MVKVGDRVKYKSPNGAFVSEGVVTRVEGDKLWVKNSANYETTTKASKLVPLSTKVGPVKTKDPGKSYIQRWAADEDSDE